MLISCGIQWLAQPSRYFCHAQSYLKGTSWFKSARQLMIFLSSTWMRDAPISISSRPVPVRSESACGASSRIGLTCGAAPAVVISCSLLTIPSPACGAGVMLTDVSASVKTCSVTVWGNLDWVFSSVCSLITLSVVSSAVELAPSFVLLANFAKGSSQLLSIFCYLYINQYFYYFIIVLRLFFWLLYLLLASVTIWIKNWARSEERRVGKSVDLGGRRIIKKKKKKKKCARGEDNAKSERSGRHSVE